MTIGPEEKKDKRFTLRRKLPEKKIVSPTGAPVPVGGFEVDFGNVLLTDTMARDALDSMSFFAWTGEFPRLRATTERDEMSMRSVYGEEARVTTGMRHRIELEGNYEITGAEGGDLSIPVGRMVYMSGVWRLAARVFTAFRAQQSIGRVVTSWHMESHGELTLFFIHEDRKTFFPKLMGTSARVFGATAVCRSWVMCELPIPDDLRFVTGLMAAHHGAVM